MTDHRAGAGSGATPDQVFKTFEWQEVCRRARLGRTYSGLAAVLAGYADKDGTKVFPGVAGLANDAEVSYNVAKAFLKFMQQVGLIRLVRRRYHRGVRISDEYQLTLDWALIDRASKKDDVAFYLPDPSERRAAVEALDARKRGKHKPVSVDVEAGDDAGDEAVDNAPTEVPSPVDERDLAAHGTGRSIQEVAAHRTGRRVEAAAHGTTHLAAHPIGANQAMDHPMVKRTTPPTSQLSSQRSRPRSSTADRPAGRPPSARRPRPPRPSSGPARRPARRRSPRIASWVRSAMRRASARRDRSPAPPVNQVHT